MHPYVKNQLSDAAAAASVGNGFAAGGRTWEISGAAARRPRRRYRVGVKTKRCILIRNLMTREKRFSAQLDL